MEGHVDAPLRREVPGNERPEDLLVVARHDREVDLVHGAAQADVDMVETRAATASLTWHFCLRLPLTWALLSSRSRSTRRAPSLRSDSPWAVWT
eukprot:3993080-Pyramimonas_sp.AAC.1